MYNANKIQLIQILSLPNISHVMLFNNLGYHLLQDYTIRMLLL